MESDVDELFIGARSEDIGNIGLAESIVCEGPAHFSECVRKLVVGESSAWGELACALKLRVDCCAFCAVDCEGADKGARRAAESYGDAIVMRRGIGLNGVVKASGEELAEAGANIVFMHRRPCSEGQIGRKGNKAIGRHSFKGDAPNRQTFPASEWGRLRHVAGRECGVDFEGRRIAMGGRDFCRRQRLLSPSYGSGWEECSAEEGCQKRKGAECTKRGPRPVRIAGRIAGMPHPH